MEKFLGGLQMFKCLQVFPFYAYFCCSSRVSSWEWLSPGILGDQAWSGELYLEFP